jgi:hypothetical protein
MNYDVSCCSFVAQLQELRGFIWGGERLTFTDQQSRIHSATPELWNFSETWPSEQNREFRSQELQEFRSQRIQEFGDFAGEKLVLGFSDKTLLPVFCNSCNF